jgi:sugar lactone lactonase YvrE
MTVEVFPHRPGVAVPCGCTLGEGVIWDDRTGTVLWVDINEEQVWSWRPGGGEDARAIPVGERVGFVLLTDDPDIVVLGLKSGLARYSFATGAKDFFVRPEQDEPGNRLNDGVVGPDGSLYFGSLNDTDARPTGHFYRWAAGALSPFGTETKTTNGPAIDAERRWLYATDSSRKTIHRHALQDDGAVGPSQPFVTFREGDGTPDGMTVDAEGHLWVCHFRGGRVTRFDPDGHPVLLVVLPTSQVTKVAFGGPDLATLFITTAARDLDREIDPMAGHLFQVDVGVTGVPAFRLPSR